MDEINIFLLAIVLAILVRRIFSPHFIPIDILWIPLISFIFYWFLIELQKQQNPELSQLWQKLYLVPPRSFERFADIDPALDALEKVTQDTSVKPIEKPKKKEITMKDSLESLQDVMTVKDSGNEILLKSALVVQTLNDKYQKANEEPTEEMIETDLQNLYNQELPGKTVSKEQVNFINQVLKTTLKDYLPKEKEDFARIIFEKVKTAPTPLGYITPPTSTSFTNVGPSSDKLTSTEQPRTTEQTASVPIPPRSPILEQPNEVIPLDYGTNLTNGERVVPVPEKKENFADPVGLLSDMIIKSLPQPLANQNIKMDVYLHNTTPDYTSSKCGTVDQNFYIFGGGNGEKPTIIQTNDGNQNNGVAPVASAMTFNGPLSADFQWASQSGANSPFLEQQRNKFLSNEREIMGGNGLIPKPEKVESFSENKNEISKTLSRNVVPLQNQPFPRINNKKVQERHRVPKIIYADESGGERIIQTNEWENQFKGLLPKGKEIKQEEGGKACFPSGVIQTSAWKEWKPVVQVEAE